MKKGKELNKYIGNKSRELRSEVARSIRYRQQVEKPTGPDEAPAELFKAGEETVLDRIHICVAIWETITSGQRNGRPPRSSYFPRKMIFNDVQITKHCS